MGYTACVPWLSFLVRQNWGLYSPSSFPTWVGQLNRLQGWQGSPFWDPKSRLNYTPNSLVKWCCHLCSVDEKKNTDWDFYLGTVSNRNLVLKDLSVSCYRFRSLSPSQYVILGSSLADTLMRPDLSRPPGKWPTVLRELDVYLGLSFPSSHLPRGPLFVWYYQPAGGAIWLKCSHSF